MFSYDYYIDSTKLRQTEITRLDTLNVIVSGLFEFTCFNIELQDTFKITKGRFDLSGLSINP
jgi:hypothetical protein